MRLIDAKRLETQIKEAFRENPVVMGIMLRWIRKQPTADAVEIVRCRDCKEFMEYTREYAQTTDGAEGDCYIRLMNGREKQYAACKYDDFCSYGERKDNDEF